MEFNSLLFAGIASGLTIGLTSLDHTTLEVLAKTGTPTEQANAKQILPIVKNHHLLLVTLLLATSSAEEAMPLFLERMMPAWASIIVSVTIVLICAEVVPMAICTRYGLEVGAKLSWLVWILTFVCYPVAWPIGKILDLVFGSGNAGTLFKRSQLKELINLHSKHTVTMALDVDEELKKLPVEDRLTTQEVALIKNSLDLNFRVAMELSTMIDDVYMLEYSQICDREVISAIVLFGLHYSVPVYRRVRDNIVGVIRVSDLIMLSPDENLPISSLELDPILKVPSNTPVYQCLTQMQSQQTRIAVLVDPQLTRIPVAVLVVEDIIEEIVTGLVNIEIFPSRSIEADRENPLEDWMNPEEDVASNHSGRSGHSTMSAPPRPHVYFDPHQHAQMAAEAHLAAVYEEGRPVFEQDSHPSSALLSRSTAGTGSTMREPRPPFERPPLEHGHTLSEIPISSSQLRARLVPVTAQDYDEIELDTVLSNRFADHDSLPDLNRKAVDEASSTSSKLSNNTVPSDFGSQLPRTHSIVTLQDAFLGDGKSEASNKTAPTFLSVRTPEKRKKPKDATVAHQVEKKLSAASVVATVLKRSSSNVSVSTLPVIYKRNHVGQTVVDPEKLLSASHGDIHDIPALTAPIPRPLSASQDALSNDDERVNLDW